MPSVSWSKSKEPTAVTKTQEVFDRMVAAYEGGNVGARPSLHSYMALMTAVIRSGADDSAERAEGVLEKMFEAYEDGNRSAKPNALAMTLVIDAWAKSGAREGGERAESLLNRMIDLFESGKDDSFKPNEVSFSATMNAWAKARVFGKAVKARAVLDRMVEMYETGRLEAKPNTLIYTTLLNACAYAVGDSVEKIEAFQIATEAFKELCRSKYGIPNHVTYSAFITACRNLLPEGDSRTQSVAAVFHKCCKDGQLDKLIVHRVESVMTPVQLQEMFGCAVGENGKVNLQLLPEDWTRNVKKSSFRRKKSSFRRGPTNKRP